MRFLRVVTTPFIFLACLGISLAAAWRVWERGIPEEDPAGRAARERERATTEVAMMVRVLAGGFERMEMREQYAFVDRLDFFLRRGAVIQARPGDFSRRGLRENAERVAQIWIRSRANRYSRLPPREQRPYLNEQFLALQAWAPLAALAFGFEPRELVSFYDLERRRETLRAMDREDPRIERVMDARDELLDWANRLEDDQRQRVTDFVELLQERFVSPLQ